MSKKPRIYLRVEKGALVPADPFAATQLRERGYKIGQVVQADITMLRTQGFNRLAHLVGGMIAANVAGFEGMDAHKALKRLQIESGVACEEIGLDVPGFGKCIQKIPRSFSFDSMGEDEYRQAVRGICEYVSRRYWPTVSPEQIEAMAEVWVSS